MIRLFVQAGRLATRKTPGTSSPISPTLLFRLPLVFDRFRFLTETSLNRPGNRKMETADMQSENTSTTDKRTIPVGTSCLACSLLCWYLKQNYTTQVSSRSPSPVRVLDPQPSTRDAGSMKWSRALTRHPPWFLARIGSVIVCLSSEENEDAAAISSFLRISVSRSSAVDCACFASVRRKGAVLRTRQFSEENGTLQGSPYLGFYEIIHLTTDCRVP